MSKGNVHNQLTISEAECLSVLRREIGLKTTCMPFAVKVMTALKTLTIKTEDEALNSANVFLSGMQTLMQGGIIPEDYDKMDFVKRGKTIVPTARVEAFLRAASRKGYRITDTIIAVPTDDKGTTYFKENFYNGDIIYTLEDRRLNPDRAITAERVIKGYFNKFICRLDIHSVKTNQRIVMLTAEIPNEDMLKIVNTSEQGFYKSEWIEYDTNWGKKKKKVITKELNEDGFWYKWTDQMVAKTIIRRALKRVKEVLPELQDTVLAFEQDVEEHSNIVEIIEKPIAIPIQSSDVDLHNLTPEEKADRTETLALWRANPKLAEDSLNEIKTLLENGGNLQTIINTHYASIACLIKSPPKWVLIKSYFEEVLKCKNRA